MYALTERQKEILLAIDRCGPDPSVRQLAEQMGVNVSSAYKAVMGLVKKGIIQSPFAKRERNR